MKRSSFGFTLIELLVVISIIGILAALAIPAVSSALVKGQMTSTMSNGRQLQIATQQMSLDNFTAGDATNWTSSGTNPLAFKTWLDVLTNGYLKTNEIVKMFQAPGLVVADYQTLSAQNGAWSVNGVNENDSSDTILFVTRNWENYSLNTNQAPYKDKGFIVVQKGGAASTLQPRFASNTNAVGSPGANSNITFLQ